MSDRQTLLTRRYFGLKLLDLVIAVWSIWMMWRALSYEASGEHERALFWLVFIWLVLWVTHPRGRR